LEGYTGPIWERMKSGFDIDIDDVEGFIDDFKDYCKERHHINL